MITLTQDKYLSTEEKTLVLESLKRLSSNPKNHRDILLIELAIYSGAREGELLFIEKRDLDPKAQTVFIRHAEKGSSPRVVPLPAEFFARLWTYASGVDSILFPISTRRVRQIWEQYRPVNKKFHALRHTFGRSVRERLQAKNGGEDVSLKQAEIIQYLMGHKSITSTMIYIKSNLEPDSIRTAVGL